MVQPCIWFMEEPSQFAVGQTSQSLTCSIMEKPHTGLDDCKRVLQECFRKMMPDWRSTLHMCQYPFDYYLVDILLLPLLIPVLNWDLNMEAL